MNIFLEELSKQYPDDLILLCCDGAAWHKSNKLHIPENIELFYIPPYTPEMNPIEQIWKELRITGFRNEVFASCQPDYIAGLSLLGGEPMEPENQRELLPFVRNFKALYPNKTVWCYSGYTWEQLTGKEPSLARCEATDELLSLLDVLVDGRFVEAQHDISLRFRGSSNQRLLGVPKSLAAKAPVWWEDEQVFATHTM